MILQAPQKMQPGEAILLTLLYYLPKKPSFLTCNLLFRNCVPGSLAADKVKGKILVCDNSDGEYSAAEKAQMIIKTQHGSGIVIIDEEAISVASNYGSSPVAAVTKKDADLILSYINTTKNPVATILATKTVTKYKPAPAIAYFSARGPTISNINLLKVKNIPNAMSSLFTSSFGVIDIS